MQRGMVLRRGTGAQLVNHVIMGISAATADVRDASTAALATTGELVLKNSLCFENGAGGVDFPAETTDNDGNFDEAAYFKSGAMNNEFGTDPQLTDPYNKTAPSWMPRAGSPALSGGATPPNDGFFDVSATYRGAFGTTDWTAGWTAYPAN